MVNLCIVRVLTHHTSCRDIQMARFLVGLSLVLAALILVDDSIGQTQLDLNSIGRQAIQQPVPDPVPNQAVGMTSDDVILSRASVESLCTTLTQLLDGNESYYQFTIRIDAMEITIVPHSSPVKINR